MKIKFIFVITILLISSIVNAFGQVRTISENEYNKLKQFEDKLDNLSYKRTSTYGRYKDDVLTGLTKYVKIHKSKKRIHYIDSETEDGITKVTSEIIRYDGREFRKKGSEDWIEIERNVVRTNVPVVRVNGSVNIKQYAIGKSSLNGEIVNLYSSYRVNKSGKNLWFHNNLTFVSDEGKILQEQNSTSVIFPNNIVSRTVVKYKYDTELKVEIPQNSKKSEKK